MESVEIIPLNHAIKIIHGAILHRREKAKLYLYLQHLIMSELTAKDKSELVEHIRQLASVTVGE